MLFTVHLCAQNSSDNNFYSQIKNYDLSSIFAVDSVLTEDSEGNVDKLECPEILGFIGDDYFRFQIHYNSIIQNPKNHFEYIVSGNINVNNLISSFNGMITIKQSSLSKNPEKRLYKQGFVICEVVLYENKNQTSTGFIKGILKSDFIIDDKKQFRYDALMFNADGFSNNQFIGTWTSYKTKKVKKCNWGDYRIPNCGDLDIGAGEFSVNEKYKKNGWETYNSELAEKKWWNISQVKKQ